MTIRTRLLLLVFAVWLPAMTGFGLLARSTYVHEARTAQDHVRDATRALQLVIDRELDKRAAIARALGAARALHDGDLERFHADARARGLDVSDVIENNRGVLVYCRTWDGLLIEVSWHRPRS